MNVFASVHPKGAGGTGGGGAGGAHRWGRSRKRGPGIRSLRVSLAGPLEGRAASCHSPKTRRFGSRGCISCTGQSRWVQSRKPTTRGGCSGSGYNSTAACRFPAYSGGHYAVALDQWYQPLIFHQWRDCQDLMWEMWYILFAEGNNLYILYKWAQYQLVGGVGLTLVSWKCTAD